MTTEEAIRRGLALALTLDELNSDEWYDVLSVLDNETLSRFTTAVQNCVQRSLTPA